MISPAAAQQASTNTTDAPAGIPACKVSAVITVDMARIEPTERSIPPVRMTKYWPIASTTTIEAAVITFSALRNVKKSSET
ncbi:hypothetical protein D9M72_519070 [compost metagenome]